ncbi:MAG: SemiSWEET transporter [Alphaproteobacteria bacterium]|nr:SemiSWEET transporter [Alphaproteobacteria bacterium]
MALVDIIGTFAASLTTFAYVPQAVKVLRERKTHAISLGMYIVMSTGIAAWIVFGAIMGSWPLVIGNGVTLVLTLTILWTKLRYR